MAQQLTNDEIDDILSVIQFPPNAGFPDVNQLSEDELKISQRRMLENIKLVDSPEARAEFKERYGTYFRQSLIRPGEMIGHQLSEAITHFMIQAVLHAKRGNTGKRAVLSGVEVMNELITLPDKRINPESHIYYKTPVSEDDVFGTSYKYTALHLDKLVSDNYALVNTSDNNPPPSWYDIFLRTMKKKLPVTPMFLRLNLDVVKMLGHKVTMGNVAQVVEEKGGLMCIYSPLSIGVMDLYPIGSEIVDAMKTTKGYKTIVDNLSVEQKIELYLTSIVASNMANMLIAGIDDLGEPTASTVMLRRFITSTVMEAADTWRVYIDEVLALDASLTLNDYIKFFYEAGYHSQILSSGYGLVIVGINEDPLTLFTPETKNPYAKLVSGIYTNTNFTELLKRDELDETKTYDNNPHRINEKLGIEATRNFIIREVMILLRGLSSINVRHIYAIYDFMLMLGKFSPVTLKGVQDREQGRVAEATVQQSDKAFSLAGLFGESQPLTTVSAAVFTGQLPHIGKTMVAEMGKSKKMITDIKALVSGRTTKIAASDMKTFLNTGTSTLPVRTASIPVANAPKVPIVKRASIAPAIPKGTKVVSASTTVPATSSVLVAQAAASFGLQIEPPVPPTKVAPPKVILPTSVQPKIQPSEAKKVPSPRLTIATNVKSIPLPKRAGKK